MVIPDKKFEFNQNHYSKWLCSSV